MKRLVLKVARITAGVLLVILGIIGLLLPVLPGIPFLILGVGLLSVDIPAVKRQCDRVIAYLREKQARSRK